MRISCTEIIDLGPKSTVRDNLRALIVRMRQCAYLSEPLATIKRDQPRTNLGWSRALPFEAYSRFFDCDGDMPACLCGHAMDLANVPIREAEAIFASERCEEWLASWLGIKFERAFYLHNSMWTDRMSGVSSDEVANELQRLYDVHG